MRFLLLLSRTFCRPLSELLTTLSAFEFQLYYAEFLRAPWDELRADLGPAMVAATIANVNRGKGSKAFSAADFMPYLTATRCATPAPPAQGLVDFFGINING